MNWNTDELIKLISPDNLDDMLSSLKQRGVIENFRIGKLRTTIMVSKAAEIADILKDEIKSRQNNRPIVKNKLTKTT